MTDLAKLKRVKILFDPALDRGIRADIAKNLSAAIFSHQGKYLWLWTDEFTAIERFTRLENSPDVLANTG